MSTLAKIANEGLDLTGQVAVVAGGTSVSRSAQWRSRCWPLPARPLLTFALCTGNRTSGGEATGESWSFCDHRWAR